MIDTKRVIADRPKDGILTKTLSNYWKRHWIKTVSLISLLILGGAFWKFQHRVLQPISWPKQPAQFSNAANTPRLAAGTDKRWGSKSWPSQQAMRHGLQTARLAPLTQQPLGMGTVTHTHLPAAPPAKKQASPLVNSTPTPTYTLQLMSGMNVKALSAYIRKHQITNTARIMKTQYNGHDWYVLTYGQYKKYSEAKMASANLPADIKTRHPWIRSTKQLAPMNNESPLHGLTTPMSLTSKNPQGSRISPPSSSGLRSNTRKLTLDSE